MLLSLLKRWLGMVEKAADQWVWSSVQLGLMNCRTTEEALKSTLVVAEIEANPDSKILKQEAKQKQINQRGL